MKPHSASTHSAVVACVILLAMFLGMACGVLYMYLYEEKENKASTEKAPHHSCKEGDRLEVYQVGTTETGKPILVSRCVQ